MFTTLQTATLGHFGIGREASANARRIAGQLFDRAHSRGQWRRWWAKLSGAEARLVTLPRRPEAARRTAQTVVVSLENIVGSEGRSEDFDANFNPLNGHNRERWMSVAVALYTGVALPAVELVQAGETYYVRDGHHRISVARALGQMDIEARIVN